ncbi:phage gp6-like head-tail connector protein [Enterobacter oligotrophicus]|uniref:phage gp6-like head-tail connector protein n=1 Tax=Enterobacter oligotrophicus TaxID=2478464 RepID=UPI0028B0B92F|nr:phage gp6-like head-tail connector protein [Enterobacter oligotrophicus]
MNERELSLIRVLGEEFSLALGELRESFSKSLSDYQQTTEEQLTRLSLEIAALKNTPAPDFTTLLADAVASLPVPEIPELPDIGAMVSEAVAAISAPDDGKSVTVDEIIPLLEGLVSKAVGEIPVPKDGKSVTVEDVRPMIQEIITASMPELPDVKSLVSEAVAELPDAEPGKDGEDGRDALALEIHPLIDEGKSYPRGSYATHNGGLWRAYEKTHGMRGWECLVDGVAGVDIEHSEQRSFTLTVNRTSGISETKTFDVPVMIYQGVFKSGQEYQPGDTVTWGGSIWHCDEKTMDKPGETGSKGWTLAAKRGRDGRDKT